MKNEKGNYLFHKLDRYIGIPIVFLLGLFKRKRTKCNFISKIAIVNLGSIGDSVLMSACILDLKSEYPDSNIDLFTGNSNYSIVKLIPGINQVVKLSVTNIFKSYKIIKKSGNYDILVDFGPWPRINAIYSSFFKAQIKIGFKTLNQFRHYVYDKRIPHSSAIHEINNFRNLIKDLNFGSSHNQQLNIIATSKSNEIINKSGKYCIIHPWPGGYNSYMKEWPNSYWVDLISKINNHFDTIFITGSDQDFYKSNQLLNSLKTQKVNIINISGVLNMQELVHFISRAELIISVNTGIAHIAATFNVNQICLNGPTNIERWGPVSYKTIQLRPNKGNYGYLNYGFEYYKAKENCMENIYVEDVYEKVLSIIN